jgi:hypothetical protein
MSLKIICNNVLGRNVRIIQQMTLFFGLMLVSSAVLAACGDGGDVPTSSANGAGATSSSVGGAGGSSTTSTGGSAAGGAQGSDEYAFDSRFSPGDSPVSYSGQSMRQLLIAELKADIGGLTPAIDGDTYSPADTQAVLDRLNFYYDTIATQDCATISIEFTATDPPLLQENYADISCKNLKGKLAGNDTATDHTDWSQNFLGWSDWSLLEGDDTNSPEGLLQALFATIAKQAYDRENGTTPCEPGSSPCVQLPVHVTDTGLDLQQLVQKFLTVAVAYSQGADDYLDSDVDGKGLLSSNAQDGDKPYSKLGHAWDEAFGYFGASRTYPQFSDDEIAGKGGRDDWQTYHDADGDMKIDYQSEVNLGVSVNAAKLDRGSVSTTPTDLTAQAFDAFVAGRALILSSGDELTASELDTLKAYRDQIVNAWEKALAATVIHYVNEVASDIDKMGSQDYAYASHVKHWSELKGFALGLQFNPRSKVQAGLFPAMHLAIGDQPVLATATAEAQQASKVDLLAMRDVLAEVMGFTTDQVQAW